MGNKGDGGKQRQHPSPGQAEPDGPEHNGEITETAIDIMIEQQMARGKKMEQSDGDDKKKQREKKNLAHVIVPEKKDAKGDDAACTRSRNDGIPCQVR
jgi:hypothetical protein